MLSKLKSLLGLIKPKALMLGEAILPKLKSILKFAISCAPLPLGIAIGYLGHPFIKIGLDMAKLVFRMIMKL